MVTRADRLRPEEEIAVLVREAMNAPAVTVLQDDDLGHAARVLLRHDISSVPVLDDDGSLCGVLSESDLLRDRVGSDPRAHMSRQDGRPHAAARTVAEVMTPRPLTVQAGADLADAAELLTTHGIKALPVLEGRRLVGVLARRDVLRTTARPDDEVRDDVATRLTADLPGQEWRVQVHDGFVVLDGAYPASQQRIAAVLARTVAGVVGVGTVDDDLSLDRRPTRLRP